MEKAKNPILNQPRPFITIVTVDTSLPDETTSKKFSLQSGCSKTTETIILNVLGNKDSFTYSSTYSVDQRALVNPLRQQGLDTAKSTWVWFLDRDCDVSMAMVHRTAGTTLAENKDKTLIGGLYSSTTQQNIWQRSYNRMCNVWSLYNQIPIAGNMLIQKDHLPKDFSWKNIPFGNEETYLVQQVRENNLYMTIDQDLKVFHKNNKTFFSLLGTAWHHSKARSHNKISHQPKTYTFFRILKTQMKESLPETLIALSYFSLVRFFQIIPNKKAQRSWKSARDSSSQ